MTTAPHSGLPQTTPLTFTDMHQPHCRGSQKRPRDADRALDAIDSTVHRTFAGSLSLLRQPRGFPAPAARVTPLEPSVPAHVATSPISRSASPSPDGMTDVLNALLGDTDQSVSLDLGAPPPTAVHERTFGVFGRIVFASGAGVAAPPTQPPSSHPYGAIPFVLPEIVARQPHIGPASDMQENISGHFSEGASSPVRAPGDSSDKTPATSPPRLVTELMGQMRLGDPSRPAPKYPTDTLAL